MTARLGLGGAVLTSMVWLACGGSSSPGLVITPSTLAVTAGSTPAGFTATLTGSSSTISWSLTGPGTLGATTGTTTSYSPPTSVAAATTATITATAGTFTASATITINPAAAGLTVSPVTLSVAAGTAGTLFTATLAGPTATISWALTGPGTLSATTGPTTNYTPPVSVVSTTTATLTASAGTFTASATITITVPPSITVTGSVIAANGLPIASAAVVIGTQNTVSSASGSFTIAGVVPPYDVAAILGKVAVVYQGLRLPSPTLVFPNQIPTLPNSGTVMGAITPTTNLATSGYETGVTWGSPETSIFGDFDTITANPYSVALTWMGPTTTTGNVHALQWQETSNMPTAYTGYGMAQGVAVVNSGTTTANVTLAAVSSQNISGTVSTPPSYTITFNLMSLFFDDGAELFAVSQDESGSTTFNDLVPSGIGATATLLAIAEGPDAGLFSASYQSEIAPNTSNVAIVVPAAASPESPPPTASGVSSATNFTWTPFAGGVHLVTFAPAVSTNPTYYVFTSATTTTIPNLTVEGLGLPTGGVSYTWNLIGLAPFATLDAFATGNNFSSFASSFLFLTIRPPLAVPDFSYSLSNSSAFTTQ
jgi:hypothetical protein